MNRLKFWKDGCDEPLCESFSSLFALYDSKEAWVADFGEQRGVAGNWSFLFLGI